MEKKIKELIAKFDEGNMPLDELETKLLILYGVSDRLEPICAKAEPLIIEINKDHLVELYNFAYEQAVKTGKVDELKEIDGKINGC